jgi:DMSO reductase anchor subunit
LDATAILIIVTLLACALLAALIARALQRFLNRRCPDSSARVNAGLKRGFDVFHMVKLASHFVLAIGVSCAVWQHARPGSTERDLALAAILLLIGGGIWFAYRRLDRAANKTHRSSGDEDRFTRG